MRKIVRKNSITFFYIKYIFFFVLTENISFHPIPLSRSLFTSIEQKSLFLRFSMLPLISHENSYVKAYTRTNTTLNALIHIQISWRWRIRTNGEIVLAMQNHVEWLSLFRSFAWCERTNATHYSFNMLPSRALIHGYGSVYVCVRCFVQCALNTRSIHWVRTLFGWKNFGFQSW